MLIKNSFEKNLVSCDFKWKSFVVLSSLMILITLSNNEWGKWIRSINISDIGLSLIGELSNRKWACEAFKSCLELAVYGWWITSGRDDLGDHMNNVMISCEIQKKFERRNDDNRHLQQRAKCWSKLTARNRKHYSPKTALSGNRKIWSN